MNTREKILDGFLTQDAYWVVNKQIARKVGIDAAIVLSDLMSKKKYFASKNQLTEDGYFFNTAFNMETDTGISRRKRERAINTLVEMKWLQVSLRGIPAKNHYRLDYDAIYDFLTEPENPLDFPVRPNMTNTSVQNEQTGVPESYKE